MSGLDLYEKENNERLSKLRLTDTIEPTPWVNDYLLLAGYALVITATIVVITIGIRRYRQRRHQKPPPQENIPIPKHSETTLTTSPSSGAGSTADDLEKVSIKKAIIWFIGIFIFSGLLGIAAASIFGAAVGSNTAIGTMLGGIAWIFSTKEGKALKEKNLNPFKNKK